MPSVTSYMRMLCTCYGMLSSVALEASSALSGDPIGRTRDAAAHQVLDGDVQPLGPLQEGRPLPARLTHCAAGSLDVRSSLTA